MAWKRSALLLLRVLAPVVGAAVVGVTLPKLLTAGYKFPGGYRMRAIALELVRTPESFKDTVDHYPKPAIPNDLTFDTWVVIPCYLLFFLLVSICLPATGASAAIAMAVACAAAVMALFDLLENWQTWTALGLDAVHARAVDAIRHAALVKWSSFMALLILLGMAFVWHSGWVAVLGGVYLGAAMVGVMGLISIPHRPLISWAFALAGVAFVFTGETVRSLHATSLLPR